MTDDGRYTQRQWQRREVAQRALRDGDVPTAVLCVMQELAESVGIDPYQPHLSPTTREVDATDDG